MNSSDRRNRSWALPGGLIAVLLGVGPLAFAAPAGTSAESTTAQRLVQEAQQAEVAGDTARHYALLRAAIRIAPDYKLAHWQLGQVQVGDDWLAIEEAQRRTAADPKQADYRRLRAEQGESPAGQLALARWCRKNDLEEESRIHWAGVLSVEPNHAEALRALDMRWYEGRLLSHDDINQAKKESGGKQRATRRWSAEVAAWERALAKKNGSTPAVALDEIRAVTDLEAIPAFERVTLGGDQSGVARNDARRQLSLAFLGALNAMADHAATQSLVRHAVLAPFSDVRDEASDQLRDRPLHDFVPLLLDGLAAPIETSFRIVADEDGSVHYLHSMYREGPFADWSHRASRSIHRQAAPARITARLASDDNLLTVGAAAADARAAAVSAAGAMRSARRYQQEGLAAEQLVVRTNQVAAALNERIIAVLASVTDQDLGSEPRAWWDWWQKDNEYYQPDERPVYASQDASNEYIVTPPVQRECFARGTLVWTKTGQQPIETLELGDLVLAQNVDTGELAYKPVIGRTVRPPSPILKLSFAGEQLLATRGHPFWVAGVGWRMAKELGDGASLYSVTGSARVEAVEEADQAEAYNLVVADFNTYFVGESGVLVHDNTPRTPTPATVPGLAK